MHTHTNIHPDTYMYIHTHTEGWGYKVMGMLGSLNVAIVHNVCEY